MCKSLSCHYEKSLLLYVCLVAGGMFQSLSVEATTVQKLSLEELTRKSEKVVVGRCVSTESRWNEKNTLILTFSKFLVTEDLKGESSGWVTVMTVGGTVNGITQSVAGTPQFAPDEEAVLFLEGTKSSQWQPVGLAQGRFRILKESRTGQRQVLHDLSGLEFYDTSAQRSATPQRSHQAPLDSFLRQVRGLIQAQR